MIEEKTKALEKIGELESNIETIKSECNGDCSDQITPLEAQITELKNQVTKKDDKIAELEEKIEDEDEDEEQSSSFMKVSEVEDLMGPRTFKTLPDSDEVIYAVLSLPFNNGTEGDADLLKSLVDLLADYPKYGLSLNPFTGSGQDSIVLEALKSQLKTVGLDMSRVKPKLHKATHQPNTFEIII